VSGGTGTTYVILFAVDGFGKPPPVALPGVRLPQLAEYLQAVVPEQADFHQEGRWPCCWPYGLWTSPGWDSAGEFTSRRTW
jgi:hypothetical protein